MKATTAGMAAGAAGAGTSSATRWTLAEAMEIVPALSELAEEHGFRLSLFGSVLLKGEGNDLDLLFSPFGSTGHSEVLFIRDFGGVLKGARMNAAHNVRAFQVEKNGKLFDLVFGGFWSPRRK
jgi:hypothetical protein